MIRAISIGVAVIFLLQIFYYTSKHRLRDRYAFLWMMIGLLGLATAIAIPLLNKLASKIAWPICPHLCSSS
ncbi:DUF2304 family protein [Paenibacillus larvae]|nr:DUF2304 family protein [Paenibacillus larvae]MDT2262737.1 DUF2304 family protein [Paenibacillus larvae]